MIFHELTDAKKQKYRALYKDVKQVADSLSKKDLNYICGGTFKNSPYVVYRDVYYDKKKPIGFIDVYSIDQDDMHIVLSVNSDYRGKGIASKLVKEMEQKIDVGSIEYITWKTDIDNTASQSLAKDLGYRMYKETKTSKIYRKKNPCYKEIEFV